jgi:hypothetical protein
MEKEHPEMILQDINGKFDLILECHESLREGIQRNHLESNAKHAHAAFLLDALNRKIDGVEQKLNQNIDGVAADMAAHRRDTEVHRGDQVSED